MDSNIPLSPVWNVNLNFEFRDPVSLQETGR